MVNEITPEILHNWYLEATKRLNPENFNKKAQVKFKDLNEEQKGIDEYIAEKIKEFFAGVMNCVFCNETGSAVGHKDKWICNECFDELYSLFKSHYYVKRVRQITDKVEKHLDKHLKS